MQKIVTLLLTAIMCSTAALAQPDRMGPKAGLGLASQSIGGLFQNTSNPLGAPAFGWHFELPLHPQLSIMPEVMYVTKGGSGLNPAQQTRTRYMLRYVEVPLLVKISTGGEPGGFYLALGPAFGYYASGRLKTWLNNELVTDRKYDLSNNARRFQTSGVVGMGYEWGDWLFEIRAQTSITPFDPFLRVQNQLYTASFAWRLPVKD